MNERDEAGDGARHRDAHPQTVLAFTFDALRRAFSPDGRTFRTVVDLARHPGRITAAYFDGRAAQYINPLQIFLFANLIFFVVGGLTRNQMLTTSLASQLCCQPYSDLSMRMVRGHIGELRRMSWNDARRDSVTENVPAEWRAWEQPESKRAATYMKYRLTLQTAITRFETRFNDASEQKARMLAIVMVPLFALIVAVLEFRRGSGLRHLVFSLHFYSFALLLYALLSTIVIFLFTPEQLDRYDGLWGRFLFIVQSIYIAVAFGAAYKNGPAGRILRGAVAGFVSVYIMQVYRFVLFLVAFYTSN